MKTKENSLEIIKNLKILSKEIKNIRDLGYGRFHNQMIIEINNLIEKSFMEDLILKNIENSIQLYKILDREELDDFNLKECKEEIKTLKEYISKFSQTNHCPCCDKKGSLEIVVDVNDTSLEDGSDEWYNSTWSFKVAQHLRIIDNLPKKMYTMDKDRVLFCNNCSEEYNATTSIHYGAINELMRTKVMAIREKTSDWI